LKRNTGHFPIRYRIVEIRKSKAMTQEALAESAHIALGTLKIIEEGRRPATSLTLKRLASALDVAVKDLVEKAV